MSCPIGCLTCQKITLTLQTHRKAKQQTCLCVLVSHRRQLVPFTTGPSMYIRSWARLLCPSARVFSRSAPCVHAPNLSSWAAVNSNKNLTVAQSRPLQTQDVISGAEPRQMSAVAAPQINRWPSGSRSAAAFSATQHYPSACLIGRVFPLVPV